MTTHEVVNFHKVAHLHYKHICEDYGAIHGGLPAISMSIE